MTFFGQQTINGLALGSVFALYALGFSLVLANLKVFHIAHAAVFTWGAVFSWQLITRWHLPLVIGLPVAAVLCGLLNVMCYVVLIRHLERRHNKELAAFISSLGGLIVLNELAANFLDHKTVGLPDDVFPIRVWHVGGLEFSSIQLLIIAVTVLMFALLRWIVSATQLGREMRTVAFDRELASMLGANVDRVSAVVFFLSGALAAVGATLIAIIFNVIDANLGGLYLVLAMTAMVVGGFGSVAGVLAGGVIVGLASSYTTGYISTSYRDVVVFALLLAFLVIRPTGLFRVAGAGERV